MAAGDEAAAAGLSVVPATADVRQGYAAINVRGDELARHMTSGTHPFTRITGQITASQIPNNVITSAKIVNGTITEDDLADGAVTTPKMGRYSINGDRIQLRTLDANALERAFAIVAAGLPVPIGGYREIGVSGLIRYGQTPVFLATPHTPGITVSVQVINPALIRVHARGTGTGNVDVDVVGFEVKP